jgi:hypothetical protein
MSDTADPASCVLAPCMLQSIRCNFMMRQRG